MVFRRAVGLTEQMIGPPLSNPPNPWASSSIEYLDEIPRAQLQIYQDNTREIVSKNDSPDIGFTYSINPYRGCTHACAYCYARPTHEYLSLGAGTDFDTKITVKMDAARLLREAFNRKSWQGETLVFSGVTDCYQPIEASLKLTQACLEVCAEYRNPVVIITKAPLVERDISLLQRLNHSAGVQVMISIPFWNAEHARAMEPYVSTPKRRVQTISRLAAAGIPVGVNVAPVIPGLGDADIVRILTAAKEAGATRAGYTLLRLPGSVKQVFQSRLEETLPLRAERVLHRIRETRGGKLSDSRFGLRGVGEGNYASAIASTFRMAVRRLGLNDEKWENLPTTATFRRPAPPEKQLALFPGIDA